MIDNSQEAMIFTIKGAGTSGSAQSTTSLAIPARSHLYLGSPAVSHPSTARVSPGRPQKIPSYSGLVVSQPQQKHPPVTWEHKNRHKTTCQQSSNKTLQNWWLCWENHQNAARLPTSSPRMSQHLRMFETCGFKRTQQIEYKLSKSFKKKQRNLMKIIAEGTKFKSMDLIFLEREQPDVPS